MNPNNNRRGQAFSPAAQLRQAQQELDAAKQKIVSLEIELARHRAASLTQDMQAAHAAATAVSAAAAAAEAEAAKDNAREPAVAGAVGTPETDVEAGVDVAAPEVGDAEAALAADVTALTTSLEKAEREREQYLELARRTQADLENYRRRTQKEYATLKRESLGSFLREFFGAFDDLDRVIAEAEKDPAAAVFRDGVRLARENLWRTLEKSGVAVIAQAEGVFDPRLHEVVAAIPAPGKAAGTILEIFQPGYQLDDFVLRPAKVVVAQS